MKIKPWQRQLSQTMQPSQRKKYLVKLVERGSTAHIHGHNGGNGWRCILIALKKKQSQSKSLEQATAVSMRVEGRICWWIFSISRCYASFHSFGIEIMRAWEIAVGYLPLLNPAIRKNMSSGLCWLVTALFNIWKLQTLWWFFENSSPLPSDTNLDKYCKQTGWDRHLLICFCLRGIESLAIVFSCSLALSCWLLSISCLAAASLAACNSASSSTGTSSGVTTGSGSGSTQK